MQETASLDTDALMSTLAALTLALRIPYILVTTPAIPLPLFVRRSTTSSFQHGLARGLLWALVLALGLATSVESLGINLTRVLNDVGLVAALASTYILPGKPNLYMS